MKRFFDIYRFTVMEEVRNGKEVYVLDKEAGEVDCINVMIVKEAFALLALADMHPDRFLFWTEEEVNEEAEENGEL